MPIIWSRSPTRVDQGLTKIDGARPNSLATSAHFFFGSSSTLFKISVFFLKESTSRFHNIVPLGADMAFEDRCFSRHTRADAGTRTPHTLPASIRTRRTGSTARRGRSNCVHARTHTRLYRNSRTCRGSCPHHRQLLASHVFVSPHRRDAFVWTIRILLYCIQYTLVGEFRKFISPQNLYQLNSYHQDSTVIYSMLPFTSPSLALSRLAAWCPFS